MQVTPTRAVVVPKAPVLFPQDMDALLDERRHACREAVRAKSEANMMRYLRLVDRYTAQIDRRAAE